MNHKPDIGFVDPHPERVRGAHGLMVTGDELLLQLPFPFRGESSVIGHRRQAALLEELRRHLGAVAGRAVDDSAASLRAVEIGADLLIKATKVDGLYDADPETDPSAKPYKSISYMEVLEKQLRVMDMTAISLAMDNNLPLVVFSLKNRGNIRQVVCGEAIGTKISN